MKISAIAAVTAVTLAVVAPPCCEAGCRDTSHWDAWDDKMGMQTPAYMRLPYGTVCEALWASDIALTACLPYCAETDEEYDQCVEEVIGMTREESVHHMETVLSDCRNGAKCCDGYQNCLDLCDAQTDQCVSHDQYASFYVNIKVELAAQKAFEMADEKMAKMAARDKKATTRSSGKAGNSKGRKKWTTERFFKHGGC